MSGKGANGVLYVHGQGGSAGESAHYEPLFPGCRVLGLDYRGNTPWEAGPEIRAAVEGLRAACGGVILVANSIGAHFSLHAGIDGLLERAYFISPIVDMEGLIAGMMGMARVTEAELEARGVIPTEFGEALSWEYLRYVRTHPIRWNVPTEILYGDRDVMTPWAAMRAFAEAHNARLTVMAGGEHWFHTASQMRFLDQWIQKEENNLGI